MNYQDLISNPKPNKPQLAKRFTMNHMDLAAPFDKRSRDLSKQEELVKHLHQLGFLKSGINQKLGTEGKMLSKQIVPDKRFTMNYQDLQKRGQEEEQILPDKRFTMNYRDLQKRGLEEEQILPGKRFTMNYQDLQKRGLEEEQILPDKRFTMNYQDLQKRGQEEEQALPEKRFTMNYQDLQKRGHEEEKALPEKRFTMNYQDLQKRGQEEEQALLEKRFTMNYHDLLSRSLDDHKIPEKRFTMNYQDLQKRNPNEPPFFHKRFTMNHYDLDEPGREQTKRFTFNVDDLYQPSNLARFRQQQLLAAAPQRWFAKRFSLNSHDTILRQVRKDEENTTKRYPLHDFINRTWSLTLSDAIRFTKTLDAIIQHLAETDDQITLHPDWKKLIRTRDILELMIYKATRQT